MEELHSCLLCGSHNIYSFMTCPSYNWIENFILCHCSDCGLYFINPRPEKNQILGYYPLSYHSDSIPKYPSQKLWLQYCVLQTFYNWPERINPIIAKPIAKGVEPFLGRAFPYIEHGKLLDIGSGNGEFLLWARNHGSDISLTGIEISSGGIRSAHDLGVSLLLGTLEDQNFANSSFDLVTMWNVLEHLPDPVNSLREVFRILSLGGYLTLIVPNIASHQFIRFGSNWWVLQIPQHLVFFSPKTIKRALEKVGFQVIRCQQRRKTYSAESVIRKGVSLKQDLLRTRILVKIEKTLDFLRSGDEIKIVAQKPK
jgi:ubiquinone/menaquinone biosynthesis C-methylase UbiE